MDGSKGSAASEPSAAPSASDLAITATKADPNSPRKRSHSSDSSRHSKGEWRDGRTSKRPRGDYKGRNKTNKAYSRNVEKPKEADNDSKVARGTRTKKQEKPVDENAPKPIYTVEFSKEEIANEERKPKRKVAMMVGYCGTGYHGLQIMHSVKTVEGDLFAAFVAAGAISKANADDPKKSSLVRCARTDKGVHAAGNVLSLKMIIEDENLIKNINDNLPEQIRVWGIEQTVNSFSAYQQCDSRVYEYLIPTYCFLPPHPQTFMGQKLEELAEEAGDLETYKERQADIASFWSEAHDTFVKPVLDEMEPQLRDEALASVFASADSKGKTSGIETGTGSVEKATTEADSAAASKTGTSKHTPLEQAVRSIKAAQQSARLAYRISPSRLARVESVLSRYVGTWKYHNYTVDKRINDPSSKRFIKSFKVSGEPFLIGNTEWLSLKVHGQSFMMHQIRKMVLMAAMLVRCGTHEARIQDSFDIPRMIIPRAPALGLLLERPIFDAYNQHGRLKGGQKRGKLEFDGYKEEMGAFKQKFIYQRIYEDEAEQQVFANFLAGLDSLRTNELLWATSLGLDAIKKGVDGAVDVDRELEDDEKPDPRGEEG